MIVDGRAIAADLKHTLKGRVVALGRSPLLSVIAVAPTLATSQFLRIKTRVADEVGVKIIRTDLLASTPTTEVCKAVRKAVRASDGIVVQLPLPEQIIVEEVLRAIPPSYDVDVISPEATRAFEQKLFPILPPVVGAFREILARSRVSVSGKRAVVVGAGRLVGKPTATWLRQEGADVQTVSAATALLSEVTITADVLVLGAGSPGLIRPDMIKEGVVLLDAGTSETGGKLVGDADPECASRASLFTPVPGGVGPITVVMIFNNLLDLCSHATRKDNLL